MVHDVPYFMPHLCIDVLPIQRPLPPAQLELSTCCIQQRAALLSPLLLCRTVFREYDGVRQGDASQIV
jgi:hypothetical protein